MPPITLTTSGYGGQIPRYLEAIIYDWRYYLGVEVEVRQLEPEVFLYDTGAEKDNLLSWGWNADYAHPQNFLEVLFGAEAEYNVGGYTNDVFNSLLEQAGVEQDIERSMALYQQAEQVLINDAPCIPLWFEENYTLVQPFVRGYEPSPLGLVRLNRVWLEN
jgi:oligopeptide transport system substrate-binding protein